MTAYIKNTPGAPTGGSYIIGDTCTDSQAREWTCVVAGHPGEWVSGGGGGTPELYAELPTAATPPEAQANNAVAIGSGAVAGGDNGLAIGTNASADDDNGLAIGNSALANLASSIAIGNGAVTGDGIAAGIQAVAIGTGAAAEANDSIAIGTSSVASGTDAIAIGQGASNSTLSGVALGAGATVNADGAVAVGPGVATAATAEAHFGTSNTNKLKLNAAGQLALVGTAAMHLAPSYLVGALPTGVPGGIIYVSDASPNPALAFFNGTNWIDVVTGVTVV